MCELYLGRLISYEHLPWIGDWQANRLIKTYKNMQIVSALSVILSLSLNEAQFNEALIKLLEPFR